MATQIDGEKYMAMMGDTIDYIGKKRRDRRGPGKPRLSENEESKTYKVVMPASLHAKALALGPERVRQLIEQA